MNSLSIGIRYRPARIGWCVESENLEHLRAALQMTCTLAGGRFNPIVPVDAGELAESLIDRFHVDLLFPVGESELTAAFVKAHEYLPWPNGESRLFHDEWHGRPPYAVYADIQLPIARALGRTAGGDQAQQSALFRWDATDPLSDVLLASLGCYPAPSSSMPNYEAVVAQDLRAEAIPIRGEDPLPELAIQALTPVRLASMVALESERRGGRPGLYVGSASDATDLIDFWNLRAAGLRLIFVDPEYRQRTSAWINGLLRHVESLPSDVWGETGRVDIWSRQNPDRAPEWDFGERRTLHRVSADVWNGLNLQPATPYWTDETVLVTQDDSHGRSTLTFALPKFPHGNPDTLSRQMFVASMSGHDHLASDRNETFFPPHIPELNRAYGREICFQYSKARSEPATGRGGALAVFVEGHRTTMSLRAMNALEIGAAMFEEFGIHSAPSRAGLVASRLIGQMGGLRGCRVFKIEGVRRLIANHQPDQHFDRTKANKTIGGFDEATRRMQFERYASLILGAGYRGRSLQPQDALDELLRRNVLRVGLELKCPHCELPSWVSLDDLATKTVCPLCGANFDIALLLRDRNWMFRRSGLFGRDDQQQGGIPVALTLDQLVRAGQTLLGSHLYTACLNLEPVRASIQSCETDFLMIFGGGQAREDLQRPQVVIGECKGQGGRISVQDAKNLARVADALPRRRVRTLIVFAKTGEFDEDEVLAAAEAQDPYDARVILLAKEELEADDVSEVDRRFQRARWRVGLAGLADAMIERYPRLRPARWPGAEMQGPS